MTIAFLYGLVIGAILMLLAVVTVQLEHNDRWWDIVEALDRFIDRLIGKGR